MLYHSVKRLFHGNHKFKCVKQWDTNPSAETSTGANTDKAAVEAQTRIISTVKGDIAVPTSPQRVVVLYLLGDVLALGIKPIGVSDVSEGAAFEDELKDVQKLGTWFEASPEAILALNPDLIIVPSEETYEALHQIAPTVLVPYEKMSTEERVSFIGQVVGKEDQAKELFTDFHKKLKTANKSCKKLVFWITQYPSWKVEKTTVWLLWQANNSDVVRKSFMNI